MLSGILNTLTNAFLLLLAAQLAVSVPVDGGYFYELSIRAPPSYSPPSSPERPGAPKRANTMPTFPSHQPVQLSPDHGATKAQNSNSVTYSSQHKASGPLDW